MAALYFYKTFPLASVYASPAFVLIGGGSTIISATVLAMIASSAVDENRLVFVTEQRIVHPANRTSRTRSFLYLSVTILASELLSPPVGSALMDNVGPYTTFALGIPCLILGLFVIPWIPQSSSKPSTDGLPTNASSREGSGIPVRGTKRFKDLYESIQRDFTSILKEKAIIVGIFALAIQKLGRPIVTLLLQYMSIKFDWKLSKVHIPILDAIALQH